MGLALGGLGKIPKNQSVKQDYKSNPREREKVGDYRRTEPAKSGTGPAALCEDKRSFRH